MRVLLGIFVFFFISTVCCVDRLPEENMTAVELIDYSGYPYEVHEVVTEDDYILTMQRIPAGRNDRTGAENLTQKNCSRQAVMLQHGLATTSTNWLTNLPHQSLAYILADNDYDVWLGNVRGNSYSRKHVTLTDKDAEYWNFSWGEMAEKDLPAMINKILNETGCEQIVYIGHSQGTLIGFAKFSTDPILAGKIKLFIALAPVSTVTYITSPIKLIAPLTLWIQATIEMIRHCSLSKMSWLLEYLTPVCQGDNITKLMCENFVFCISDSEGRSTLNQTRIPIYLSHNPDDTSVKNVVHYGQMLNSGHMQKYDYGYWKNWKKYRSFFPPQYYPEKMNVSTAIFWSQTDALTHPSDVLPLLKKIPNLVLNVQLGNFSHLDFLWSVDVQDRVYSRILTLLQKQL